MTAAQGISAGSDTHRHNAHEVGSKKTSGQPLVHDSSVVTQQRGDTTKRSPSLRSSGDWTSKVSNAKASDAEHSHKHEEPPAPRPGSVDGKFTWGEALFNLGKGALHAVTSVFEVFKDKPVLATTATAGLIGLLGFVPAAVPFVVTAATGWSSYRIIKSIGSALRFKREGKPDEAEKALRGAGEGAVGLAFVALGQALAGALEGVEHAGHAHHGHHAHHAAHGASHAGEGGGLAQSASALIHIHDLPIIAGAVATGHGEHEHDD